jgi:tRNA 2-thiouridine synthesizing protein D
MKFSLAVYAAPYSAQGSDSAYRFAISLLDQGHTLYRVFFYGDGVQNANQLISPPQDEINLPLLWQRLAQAYNIDLVVCVAAALRRGVLDAAEADRYEKSSCNLAPGFTIGGLGQLLDAAVASDRLITFGN